MKNSDFATQFYNLEGDLISERKKNFFKLLRAQPSPLKEGDLKDVTPRTYLERLFLVDTFIYFKTYTELLNVVKTGNKVFVGKILKRPLILKEIIESMSPENFVNDFLPNTSYSVRMKILKKVSVLLDESQMDEIIFWVHKRYGFNIAIKVLHTCSFKKIKDFLVNYEIKLSPRQIKFIFDKDPKLLVIYLNRHKSLTGNTYTHKTLSKYVALKNPKIWLKLQNEHKINLETLGHRTSKHFIRHDKKDFLSNVRSYSIFLNMKVMVQELFGNFIQIYLKYFPTDVNNINTGNFCHRLLRYYPKHKRWNLISHTFARVHESSILENLIHLKYDFIQTFADKMVLNKWAEVHYNKETSNYFLKYCHPNKAIPIFKEKIDVTSDLHERTGLVVFLLENCAENESFTYLEEVLRYICFEYITDDINRDLEYVSNVTTDILHKTVYLFKLEEFNENHWNYVNEIIRFSRLNKHLDYYYFTDIFTLTLKHIEYLCMHEKPFRKELATYIEDVHSNNVWFHIDLKNPKIEQQIWMEIIHLYPTIIDLGNSEGYKRQQQNFVNNIIQFNEKHPEYIIDILNFPSLYKYVTSLFQHDSRKLKYSEKGIIKSIINYNLKFPANPIINLEETQILQIFRANKKDFCYEYSVEKLVTKHKRSSFENAVLQFFWDNLLQTHYLNKRIIQWLIINEPKTVVPYFDQLLEIDKKFVDIENIKLMSHLEFDRKVIDHCIRKLQPICGLLEDITKKKEMTDKKTELNIEVDILDILAVLLPTSEYIKTVAERFLPAKEKIETADERLNEIIYFLQCKVARCLKKMEEPEIVLPTILKFCLDDYLRTALPSLCSICYRTPEQVLYTYMDRLSKTSPLIRKHALFLSCELLNFNYVIIMLQNANDSNIFQKNHVFSAILKYFRKNPSEELLNLVTVNLSRIDKKDSKILNSLASSGVPKKYTEQYVQKCWYFFENMRRKEVNVQNNLQLVLDSIIYSDDILVSLPPDFSRHIITHYFTDFPEKDHHLNNINRFVCMVLSRQKSEQSYNFKFVFNIISKFKNNNSTKVIKRFFDSFYNIAIEDLQHCHKIDAENNYHIELFKQYWFNMFAPIKMFDEHVLLNLLYLKCKSSENVIENYAHEVVVYLEELISEYGPYIYYKFKDLLLHKLSLNEKEKYLFLDSMIKFKNSTLNCLLVLDLLQRQCCDDDVKEIHNKIVNMLKNSKDPVVSVYFSCYFGEEC